MQAGPGPKDRREAGTNLGGREIAVIRSAFWRRCGVIRSRSPVAEAIVEFRNRAGITQEALAAELEICVRQIQYFEAGALIKPPVLRRLAKLVELREPDLAATLRMFTRRESNIEPIERRLAKAEQAIQVLALRLAQVEQKQDRPRDNLRLVGGGVA